MTNLNEKKKYILLYVLCFCDFGNDEFCLLFKLFSVFHVLDLALRNRLEEKEDIYIQRSTTHERDSNSNCSALPLAAERAHNAHTRARPLARIQKRSERAVRATRATQAKKVFVFFLSRSLRTARRIKPRGASETASPYVSLPLNRIRRCLYLMAVSAARSRALVGRRYLAIPPHPLAIVYHMLYIARMGGVCVRVGQCIQPRKRRCRA